MRDRKDWYRTASGVLVYALEPDPEVVRIEDIARSLSRQCRFAGHVRDEVEHYSVAQHSVLVSHECARSYALMGLLHDAAEAYTQDLIRPIKHTIGAAYFALESGWATAISAALGLTLDLGYLPEEVERADKVLLATERRDLLLPFDWRLTHQPREERIVPVRAFAAYELFMDRYQELGAQTRRTSQGLLPVEPIRMGCSEVP